MKRKGFLFEKVYEMDNLIEAHKNARKGKSYYREVKMVDNNSEFYLSWLQYLIKNNLYSTSKYISMVKITDNGKVREILKLPYYPDRIVHHAIIQVVGDIWIKTLIRDTYSSIKGRGIHDGVKRLKSTLRDKEGTKYCLKLDIKKYYPSIKNDKLKEIIKLKIKDKNLLNLIYEIIDSTEGVPIGNYLSQYFGNLYISSIDHRIKSLNKYYFRYCDDIVILSDSKDKLRKVFDILREELIIKELVIKENWQIFPVDVRGVDFLGYKFFHDYILLRKGIKNRMKKRFKNLRKKKFKNIKELTSSVMSYYGWLKYGNCKNLQNILFNEDMCRFITHECRECFVSNPLIKLN